VTQAICLQCGTQTVGAFIPCKECHFEPASEEARAKSILLSDHFIRGEGLKETARVIQSGGAVQFPEAALASVVEKLSRKRVSSPSGQRSRPRVAAGLACTALCFFLALIFFT